MNGTMTWNQILNKYKLLSLIIHIIFTSLQRTVLFLRIFTLKILLHNDESTFEGNLKEKRKKINKYPFESYCDLSPIIMNI